MTKTKMKQNSEFLNFFYRFFKIIIIIFFFQFIVNMFAYSIKNLCALYVINFRSFSNDSLAVFSESIDINT